MEKNTVSNAGDFLGLCLIATKRVINPPFDDSEQARYSVDMLRLRVKCNPNKWDEITQGIDTFYMPTMEKPNYWTSNKIGSYRCLWTFNIDDTSLVIGLGLVEGSGKTNKAIGFLEWNPNKITKEASAIMDRLSSFMCRFEPLRYDLAIDFPLKRDTLRLLKDGRKYQCFIGGSVTEYLGKRSSSGYVKVYDKAAEAKLDEPLTRVEITCDSSWDAQKIISKLPTVYCFGSLEFESLRGSTRVLAQSIMRNCAAGDSAETWLKPLDKKTRAKIRSAIKEEQKLSYSVDCITEIVELVQSIR